MLYSGATPTVRPCRRSRIILCVCAYYYIELQTAVLNIVRRSPKTHLTNFSSRLLVHPILHPIHTFIRRRRQSFVNRSGYPDVFSGKIYILI